VIDTIARLDARAAGHRTGPAGGVVAWRSWGSGTPLVLLHGASGSWTHWVRNVGALAARLRVIAPDMPGFGDSDPPAENTVACLGEALVAGLDRLVPPPAPFDLAGFSFGGIVAGVVAARLGARVRTLVLVGPNGMALPSSPPPLVRLPAGATEHEAREVHRENLRRLMLAAPDAADDLAVDIHVANLARARFRSGDIPASDTLLRALPDVRARIAGIWGGRDAFAVPDLDARRRILARFSPHLDFRIVEGAGHWVIYEAADVVNRALLEILGAARCAC
jgi:pimeloyl-ACP methyl ester carboxylesterase